MTDLERIEWCIFKSAVSAAKTINTMQAQGVEPVDSFLIKEKGRLDGLITALYFIADVPDEYAHEVIANRIQDAASANTAPGRDTTPNPTR